MTLSEELTWRGQIKDRTFDDVSWLDQPRTFFLGVDCNSADSLTIGNLAVFMMARRLRKHGWKAVMLVGGATSLIGDPGGKDDERPLKTREEIQKNVEGIKSQINRLFSDMDFTPVDNYDWFKDIGYLSFLRDVGKHYSMTELLQRDFIASRIGEGGTGISYAEFSYSLIQGYDFWQLYKEHHVELQIGGSDQWGNMLSGVPLIRKKEGQEVHALSMDLVINKATGKKFGKSEEGAVWLDAARTSPYRFYQFWLNADDEGVEDYLKIYTELSVTDIGKIMADFEGDRAARKAQKTLAYEVTSLVHGKDTADSIVRVTATLFGSANYADMTQDDIVRLTKELPTAASDLGSDLISVLVSTGLASSNSDARRFLEQGAVYVNGEPVQSGKVLESGDLMHGRFAIIRRGKNSNAIIKVEV